MLSLQSEGDLKNWGAYKPFMKEHLKLLPGDGAPFYISKKKIDFQIDGKPWKAHAILAGEKAKPSFRALRAAGVKFEEGTCSKSGKNLVAHGISDTLITAAGKTLLRLKLGYSVVAGGEGIDGGADSSNDLEAALAAWKKARSRVFGSLKELGRTVVTIQDPEAKEALIMLKAVQANISEKPDSLRKIQELERYVTTDDVVAEIQEPNPFGIEVDITDPLMNALGTIKESLSS